MLPSVGLRRKSHRIVIIFTSTATSTVRCTNQTYVSCKLGLIAFIAFTTAFSVPTLPSIGKCTMSQPMVKALECERDFYMSYRANVKEDCRKRYGKMLTCVTNGMSSCMEAMNVTLGIYNQLNLREVVCGNASFPKIPVPQGGTGCKEEFYDNLNNEMNTFYVQFRQNRGDPALCKKYHKVQQHLIDMLQSNLCPLKVRITVEQQLKGFLSTTFNPFCSKAPASNALRMHIISVLFIAVYFIWET